MDPLFSYSFSSLSQPIFNSCTMNPASLWNVFKETLGIPIRQAIFPLTQSLSLKHKKLLAQEKKFFLDFWDPTAPLNPHLPHQAEIRDFFHCKKEKISIEVEGKSFEVEYSLIEPKKNTSHVDKPLKNLIYALGNVSTNDSYIMGSYPFLASYLGKQKKESGLLPFRLILLSQYNTYEEDGKKHAPKNIDEPGLFFAHILKAITENKGPIDFIAAHSIGTVVLASSLKYLASMGSLHLLPQNLYLDRGPSSIEKATKFLGFLQPVAAQWAKYTGWDIDLGKEVSTYLADRKDQTILVANVEKDFYFPEEAKLNQNPYIQSLQKEGVNGVHCFSFDFSNQQYMPRAHHMLHNGLLDEHFLITPSSLLQKGESMADLVIRLLCQSTKQ